MPTVQYTHGMLSSADAAGKTGPMLWRLKTGMQFVGPERIEVEDALYKHPAVQAAAVVAKPDDKWGETPCAFVELKPGTKATTDELAQWCRQHLASYKCPRYVVFAEIPKTSTGKIQKFKLREMAKGV